MKFLTRGRESKAHREVFSKPTTNTTMSILLSSLLVLSFLFPSVAGFGVGQPLLQQHHPSTTTALHAVPIDTHTTDAIQSMWIATIDADIADIQLEDFRRVFAGGIVSDNWLGHCRPFFLCPSCIRMQQPTLTAFFNYEHLIISPLSTLPS